MAIVAGASMSMAEAVQINLELVAGARDPREQDLCLKMAQVYALCDLAEKLQELTQEIRESQHELQEAVNRLDDSVRAQG